MIRYGALSADRAVSIWILSVQSEKSALLRDVYFILRCDQPCTHCFVATCSLMIAILKLVLLNMIKLFNSKVLRIQNCLQVYEALNLFIVLMIVAHGFLPCGKEVLEKHSDPKS